MTSLNDFNGFHSMIAGCKIIDNIKIYYRVISFLLLPFSPSAFAQPLKIVKKLKDHCHQVENDSLKRMVELKSLDSTIVYDLRYATKNNFTGRKLYKSGDLVFLRTSPARALKIVQEELAQKGLGLKILDGYRPYHVTKRMWDLIKDERYVANPSKGSGHNRGLAIDLTIIDISTAKELDMGTGFDNFSDTAHHAFMELSSRVLQNRSLLRAVMEKHGFRALSTEWWHYSWPNDRSYDVLDLDPAKLRKQCH